MTSEALARIEEELSVSLPQTYREILLRPEFQCEAAGFMEFTGDADEVIGLILEVRKDGFYGANLRSNI